VMDGRAERKQMRAHFAALFSQIYRRARIV
jgi:hypothetical protein